MSVAAALLCSCSPSMFYQLYKVDSDGLEQKNNQLTFENEHCVISYDLWSEKGDMSFVLYNKTDKDMYIMMPQSFFIQNGMAYDYYTNAVSTSRQVSQVDRSATLGSAFAETSIMGGLWGAGKSATIGHSLTTENSTTTKEMAVVCIPPKAKKYFKGFNLVEAAHKDCDDYMLNYPKKVSDAITFGKDDSPWKFRNRIAYTFDQEAKNYKYIENELWVSYLQNYTYTAMQEQIKETPCELNYQVTRTILLNQAPNAFYNIYTKTPGATK